MSEPLWQPHDPTGSAVRSAAPPHTDGRRTLDTAISTVLLVLLLPLAVVAMFVGVLGGLGVSGCEEDATCQSVLETYVVVLVLAPPVLWVLAVVVSIVLIVRDQRAWWVSIAAALLWVLLAAGYVGAAETLQP